MKTPRRALFDGPLSIKSPYKKDLSPDECVVWAEFEDTAIVSMGLYVALITVLKKDLIEINQ